jgi:acyl dehydratase
MKFDNIDVGKVYKTKSYKVTKEKVIQYAKEFDPQYMHVDEEKAKEGRFKGIIASGLHTFSISMKLWIECDVFGDDIIAGRGMKNIKFLRPVYPDDELYAFVEVTQKTEKTNEAGIIELLLTTYNHRDEKVLEAELSALIKA